MIKFKSQKGFTLVEVLLVIAIIGIIAAVTIPIVMANGEKAKFISGLQKASNTLTNVVNSAQAESEKMETWNYNLDSKDFAEVYIVPHLNISSNCGTAADKGCFGTGYLKKDGTPAEEEYDASTNYYKVSLIDGNSIAIKTIPGCTSSSPSECVTFIVDVNGPQKPNKWGSDVFEFEILAHLNAIVPYGTFSSYNPTTGKWVFTENNVVDEGCLNGDGKYCGLKIINDGWEMNY